jgi:chromosome segregation ATPase
MWCDVPGCNTIVEELYDALIEAGVSEEKARAASRAVADMDTHFGNIEREISGLRQQMSELRSYVDQRFTEIRSYADQQLTEIRSYTDQRLTEIRSYTDQQFTEIRGILQLHNWMLGTILAFIVAVFFKVFSR